VPEKHVGVLVSTPDAQSQTGPIMGRIEEADFVTAQEDQDLKRGLEQRHIGLIAIGGAIVGVTSGATSNIDATC